LCFRFSNDIELEAQEKAKNQLTQTTTLTSRQIDRLHLILKPFMLRRIKLDCMSEMPSKTELMLSIPLSTRQSHFYHALQTKIRRKAKLEANNNAAAASLLEGSDSLLNLFMQFRKLCNHPQLIQQRRVISPLSFAQHKSSWISLYDKFTNQTTISIAPNNISPYNHPLQRTATYPRLIYNAIANHFKQKLLYHTMNLFSNPSLLQWLSSAACSPLNLLGFSTAELSSLATANPIQSLILLHLISRRWKTIYLRQSGAGVSLLLPLIHASFRYDSLSGYSPIDLPAVQINYCNPLHNSFTSIGHTGGKAPANPLNIQPTTPYRTNPIRLGKLINAATGLLVSHAALLRCLNGVYEPRVLSHRCLPYFLGLNSNPSLAIQQAWSNSTQPINTYLFNTKLSSDSLPAHQLVSTLCSQFPASFLANSSYSSYAESLAASSGSLSSLYWQSCLNGSGIVVPSFSRLLSDSGKLFFLDLLLKQCYATGHRVLIFSQMTKVLNLLEEFLTVRHYQYLRLDGSTNVADRRDRVATFQSDPKYFCFILSTRAGGLGINLTAADVVIFFDSDFNNTSDEQAMDRVHRIGQTKSVTVYRLICRNTVEERVLLRARMKANIQQTVYAGGFKLGESNEASSLSVNSSSQAAFLGQNTRELASLMLSEANIDINQSSANLDNELLELEAAGNEEEIDVDHYAGAAAAGGEGDEAVTSKKSKAQAQKNGKTVEASAAAANGKSKRLAKRKHNSLAQK
jgi:SNF2 family DNA or RNA helicase